MLTKVALALLAILMLAAGSFAVFSLLARNPADAATVTLPLRPAKADMLVAATTGDATTDLRAVGDEAIAINAALPFANGPVQAARPFAIGSSPTDENRALTCLTQAVYYEAGFEPLTGRRAVAQVVLNRMKHPAFPNSVCGVVYQNNGRVCQFTFVCDGSLNRAPARFAWNEAEKIAKAALAGAVEASVGGATHYHANYVAPRWAPLLAKVSQIGQHIFYRWPGSWGLRGAFTARYAGEARDPAALRPNIVLAEVTDPTLPAGIDPIVAGPPVARAANDVGGLLDTSKGWTLTIPGPEDSVGSAARLIAMQEGKITHHQKPVVASTKPQAAPAPAEGNATAKAVAADVPVAGGRAASSR